MSQEPPTRSSLQPLGIVIFALGGLCVASLWLMAPSPFPTTNTDDIAELQRQTAAIQDYTRSLPLRQFVRWLGETLIDGGFLMWLVGTAISQLGRARSSN